MSVKFFLDNLTPQAIKYIKHIVKTSNPESYKKLKKIFIDQSIELKSFEDTNLDIINFNWNGIERDRNWWWQAQALPFLNWYVESYNLQSEEERKKYFSLCLAAIDNWNTKTKDYDSPLAWHDHGTAFRTRNIINWITFCYTQDIDVIALSNNINLSKLIVKHLDWLLDSKNYSEYTNHGFDQSMIVLTISAMFDSEQFETHRLMSRQRLKAEIKFAFTDEGVHKENSPGYQKFMLARLKQLRTLALLNETVISELAENYIVKAEEFLRVITLPNGYLPMIGDTRGEDVGLQYSQNANIDILDYSASGYIILRGRTVTNKDFHLLFKCSHFSNYHRHDDDLSLHLFFDNVVILGDGGLGSHNEKDERRKALRSNIAHNVPYVSGINPIRSEALLEKNKRPHVYISGNKIIGESYGYGMLIRREIDFTKLLEGYLYIKDELIGDSEAKLITHFYSPLGIVEDHNSLVITDSGSIFVKIEALTNGKFQNIPSEYSATYDVFEKKESYSFYSNSKKNNTQIDMRLELEYQPVTIFKMNYRNFGPIEIKSLGNWFYDHDFPNNVCHHIMSLRWLANIESDSLIKGIVKSFVFYHDNEKNIQSKYYLGADADHTTSIRIDILLALYKKFKNDCFMYDLIKKELFKNLEACLDDTYKEKNNHGLMVDKAILSCIFEEKSIFHNFKKEIPFVFERLLKQISAIFDDEGYCKEHSISYQEYNLGIMISLLDTLKKGHHLGFDSITNKIEQHIELIKESSKKSLGYSLKDNGEYITIGDSFETPKSRILDKSFGNSNSKQALLPYSEIQGIFFSQTLGIAIFRSEKIHFSINASWHSYVHKQNDDLSVFLRISGEDIFVDGGYSDIINKSVVDTSSQYLHSTIIPKEKSWKLRGSVNSGFSRLYQPINDISDNFIIFSGSHSRVEDTIIERQVEINDEENTIIIIDNISKNQACIHRFLIPSEHEVIIKDKIVHIKTKTNTISIKCYSTKRFIAEKIMNCNKSLMEGIKDNKLRSLIALDFFSQGCEVFLISYT